MLCAGFMRLVSSVRYCATLRGLTQILKTMVSAIRKSLIPLETHPSAQRTRVGDPAGEMSEWVRV